MPQVDAPVKVSCTFEPVLSDVTEKAFGGLMPAPQYDSWMGEGRLRLKERASRRAKGSQGPGVRGFIMRQEYGLAGIAGVLARSYIVSGVGTGLA
jgi:hypothetical protein